MTRELDAYYSSKASSVDREGPCLLCANNANPNIAPVLVRDAAHVLNVDVPTVCKALVDLGFKPLRSTNMAVSGEELVAVYKHLQNRKV